MTFFSWRESKGYLCFKIVLKPSGAIIVDIAGEARLSVIESLNQPLSTFQYRYSDTVAYGIYSS